VEGGPRSSEAKGGSGGIGASQREHPSQAGGEGVPRGVEKGGIVRKFMDKQITLK